MMFAMTLQHYRDLLVLPHRHCHSTEKKDEGLLERHHFMRNWWHVTDEEARPGSYVGWSFFLIPGSMIGMESLLRHVFDLRAE